MMLIVERLRFQIIICKQSLINLIDLIYSLNLGETASKKCNSLLVSRKTISCRVVLKNNILVVIVEAIVEYLYIVYNTHM